MTSQHQGKQMATTDGARLPPPPQSLLPAQLERMAASARLTLAQTTTPNQAAKAAEQLVGQFASLRADNPKVFIKAVADVFERYPPCIVIDCIDTNSGLPSRVEFLSIKSLGEWLKTRLEWYEAVASYRRPPDPRPEVPPGAIASRALEKLWTWLRTPRADRGAPPTWHEAAQEVAAGEKRV